MLIIVYGIIQRSSFILLFVSSFPSIFYWRDYCIVSATMSNILWQKYSLGLEYTSLRWRKSKKILASSLVLKEMLKECGSDGREWYRKKLEMTAVMEGQQWYTYLGKYNKTILHLRSSLEYVWAMKAKILTLF